MAVTKVTRYETSKGEIHKTKEGAELAEKLDVMDAKLEEYLDNIFFRGMTVDQLKDDILSNRVELVEILS